MTERFESIMDGQSRSVADWIFIRSQIVGLASVRMICRFVSASRRRSISFGHRQMSHDVIDELAARLRQFAAERDWEQFHSPKNLSMALSVEVAEIVEHFQWLTEQQSRELDQDKQAEVSEELADAFIYLVRLADQLDIDLLAAADEQVARLTKPSILPIECGAVRRNIRNMIRACLLRPWE